MLRTANREIQLALYKVNRCVDTGNFHKILQNLVPMSISLVENIPVCLKVDLKGYSTPLRLTIKRTTKTGNLHVYISSKHIEPDSNNCEKQFMNQPLITYNATHGYNSKIFSQKSLFISLQSDFTAKIEVCARLPQNLFKEKTKNNEDFDDIEVQVVSRETKLKQEIDEAVLNPLIARDAIMKMRQV
jgi:hypothetical protein